MQDRYGADVLSAGRRSRPAPRQVVAETGLVVECADTGWCGAVVGMERGPDGHAVVLEDRHGRRRPFLLVPGGFLVEGERVTLVRRTAVAANPKRTASGSIAVATTRARVARASRIWVEGRHDAELVEKVWGDDLRIEGVVVEELGGIDHLPDAVREFQPGLGRRLGVLVDHNVAGSKESRLADAVSAEHAGNVLVVGHPYVDVWAAVRPEAAGIARWPSVPRGTDWKSGVCAQLGWDPDTGRAWRALLARVSTYSDLEPSLLGRVEELVDFVTAG
ncbi:MAG: DUF3097 domain-containing protein [Actinomycetota bacterium]|nr:MAG: DUF3097 domain-containing protein [Actinomycetota bacterium]